MPRAADQCRDASVADWCRISVVRCLPFFALHLLPLAIIWVGVSGVAVLAAAAAYLLRMFIITGFYHRYFSHRTFQVGRVVQCAAALLGTTAGQRGPIWWASHHRWHHRHADHEPDPHTPVLNGFLWSHVGWALAEFGHPWRRGMVRDLLKFAELRLIDRYHLVGPLVLAGAMYGLGVALSGHGTNGPQMLVWGFGVSTVVLYHATFAINSLAHLVGYRRFATDDHSTNNPVLAVITLGEGWHNNHHFYPGAVRQGFLWWELDLTYLGLRCLERMRVVRRLRPVPDAVYRTARLTRAEGL